MALKYKIGDRVRIKSIDWYNENKDEVGNIRYERDGSAYPVFFSKYMSNFCGEILTIKSVFKHSYHMNETSSCEFWTDEMIEGLAEEESEKKLSDESWKPSKEEMDVLYGLAYITNQYDEHKEEIITRLYQDLKREFFNGSSYENMFHDTEDDVRRRSTIQVLEYARSLDNYNQYGKEDIDKNIAWIEKQGKKPQGKSALEVINEKNIDNQNCVKPTDKVEPKFKIGNKIKLKSTLLNDIFGVIGYEPEGYRITNISNGLTYFMSYSIEHYYELVEEETKPKYEDEVNGEYYSTPKYLVRPSGYQFVDENGNVINAWKVVLEKKKEYPKTYEECCKVLGLSEFEYNHTGTKVWYRHRLMATLDKLMLCRDAYWKIAGEEMGLGKPWEPDWSTENEIKYVIEIYRNNVRKNSQGYSNTTLAFPTKEMRDAFYENFKEEIEICKELL